MTSRTALFSQVRELCRGGWRDIPSEFGGTGAPGLYLENLLGFDGSNVDIPDAGTFELKFSRGTSLITLFHKTPKPRGSVKHIIEEHGSKGKNGFPSFRHTIAGKSDRGFTIVHEAGSIWVRHDEETDIVPHWTDDELLNAAGRKLSRLILVTGSVRNNPRQVKFERAFAYESIKLSGLIQSIVSGLVVVDFDAYIKKSGAVRDHGTKFRIKHADIGCLYNECTKIY